MTIRVNRGLLVGIPTLGGIQVANPVRTIVDEARRQGIIVLAIASSRGAGATVSMSASRSTRL
jgi:hypothetical protein